jgi:hypothetical protein
MRTCTNEKNPSSVFGLAVISLQKLIGKDVQYVLPKAQVIPCSEVSPDSF